VLFQVPVLDIYVTGVCNLNCDYCFGEIDSRPGIAQDTFTKAMGFARAVGASTLELCGGEPLLYKNFEWAVVEARRAGFRLILRSNGYYAARYRELIAKSFSAVGISLDGDPQANDQMRPQKGGVKWSAQEKFDVPIGEILQLKALNSSIQVILASVATSQNVEGIARLASILVDRRVPIDVWKVYQFVPNHFRASVNKQRFELPDEEFDRLRSHLYETVAGCFDLRCRTASEVDGSCLIVSQNGDVLVGGKSFGSVSTDCPEKIVSRFRDGTEAHIAGNKHITYAPILPIGTLSGGPTGRSH
jgi:MoaA/NifB/PqqE/SkfB family radical SAM enzyme